MVSFKEFLLEGVSKEVKLTPVDIQSKMEYNDSFSVKIDPKLYTIIFFDEESFNKEGDNTKLTPTDFIIKASGSTPDEVLENYELYDEDLHGSDPVLALKRLEKEENTWVFRP